MFQSEATQTVATFKQGVNEALRENLLLILDARLQTEVKWNLCMLLSSPLPDELNLTTAYIPS
jgi:hypothetical protein